MRRSHRAGRRRRPRGRAGGELPLAARRPRARDRHHRPGAGAGPRPHRRAERVPRDGAPPPGLPAAARAAQALRRAGRAGRLRPRPVGRHGRSAHRGPAEGRDHAGTGQRRPADHHGRADGGAVPGRRRAVARGDPFPCAVRSHRAPDLPLPVRGARARRRRHRAPGRTSCPDRSGARGDRGHAHRGHARTVPGHRVPGEAARSGGRPAAGARGDRAAGARRRRRRPDRARRRDRRPGRPRRCRPFRAGAGPERREPDLGRRGPDRRRAGLLPVAGAGAARRRLARPRVAQGAGTRPVALGPGEHDAGRPPAVQPGRRDREDAGTRSRRAASWTAPRSRRPRHGRRSPASPAATSRRCCSPARCWAGRAC